jgi:hypothetical protein
LSTAEFCGYAFLMSFSLRSFGRTILRSTWFRVFVLVKLVLTAYAGVLQGNFLYDDEFLILRNSFLRSWSHVGDIFTSSSTGGAGQIDAFYRPLQGLLYLAVYQTAGLSPVAFHALNLAFHAGNAVLVYFLGRRLGFKSTWSWAAAALWAAHPVHTEAVSYMSATADTLYTFFCLLGVCVLLPDFSKRRLGVACMIFVLALLSKESAIVLPALATVCLFFVHPDRLRPRTYLRLWPLWVLASGYFLARRTVLDFHHSFDFYKTTNIYTENILYRFYTFLATLPSYLELLVWPRGLHMDRSFPVYTNLTGAVVVGGVLLLVALAWLVWGRGRRGLVAAFACLWFVAAHAPHMGVLLPVNSLFLEHWLYLPTVGLFLGLLHKLGGLSESRAWARVLTGGVILVLASEVYATQRQNRVWADPVTFYRNILRYEPVGSARVHNNLAMALGGGEESEAIFHYRRAIEIEDRYPQTHYNLALLLWKRGREDEAIAELKRSLELNSSFFYGYQALSEIYAKRGDRAQSEFYARQYEASRGHFGQ